MKNIKTFTAHRQGGIFDKAGSFIATMVGCAIFLCGCHSSRHIDDTTPPVVPTGVVSVTGNEEVTLYWNPNSEGDLSGYFIYRSDDPHGPYEVIGSSTSAFFVDKGVANAVTYYYAISAYDYAGNESGISAELIFDTPRPEGRGVKLWDADEYEMDAGYDFSGERVLEWDNDFTDVYCIASDGVIFMVAGDANTDIQDFGYIEELDEINYAPLEGWSQTGVVELIPGHGYVVWTNNNHFAKFRVTSATDEYARFDWAYQEDVGNRELKHIGKQFPNFVTTLVAAKEVK
ncbi:MAG: fibronectin type III domain-containing protein [bacterium]